MLEVRLFGKFEIQYNGQPVILSSRAAQSLFAYLILTAGASHRREKLAGMFWPDENEQKARTFLRNELWRIRKALSETSKAEYLLTDSLAIGFDQSSAYWLDVAGLRNLSVTASTQELIQALSDYQGELLPGFYEDWVVLEREHLQVLFEQKIASLHELLARQQRWTEGITWAERWISLGQGSETAFRHLITAYDALGDRAMVASSYKRCVQVLRQLDLEPSEETRALVFKRPFKLKIPIPLTSFIGRKKEIEDVTKLLSRSCLVTLTGSGGVGKTRLAIEVATDVLDMFPDGVWFLDLAPLSDPALVPQALANVLGIRESGELSITDILTTYFKTRMALVIFDNCEHVIKACAQLISSLLTASDNVAILATSREALRVSGEIPYRVPSLGLPKSESTFTLEALSNIEAIQLFVERAAIASPGFALRPQNAGTISEICKHLDGIPLAIELAAARINVLTAEETLKRLGDRFQLLTTGERTALPRHRTLQAMIDWSYNLLSDRERIFLQRLSVFAGGWTLEAAEFICSRNGIEEADILDLLTELLNKSLIVAEREPGKNARYQMLESIRQYALQISQPDNELSLRHCLYFARFVGARYPAIMSHLQQEVVAELLPEITNVRLAWMYAIQHGKYQELRTMAECLAYFTEFSNRLSEGAFLYSEATRVWDEHPLEDSVARLAFGLCIANHGYYEWRMGHYEQALQRMNQSVEILRPLHDPLVSFPLTWIGAILAFGGQTQQALQFLDQSEEFVRGANTETGMWMIEWARGIAFLHQGDVPQAKKCLLASVAWCRKTGDPRASSLAMSFLSRAYVACGELTEAAAIASESLAHSRLSQDVVSIGVDLTHLGRIAFAQGDMPKAQLIIKEALSAYESVGDITSYLSTLAKLGEMQLETKQLDDAHASYLRVVRFGSEAGILQYILDGVLGLAEVMLQTGDPEKAVAWIQFVQQNGSTNPDTKGRAQNILETRQSQTTLSRVPSLQEILAEVT